MSMQKVTKCQPNFITDSTFLKLICGHSVLLEGVMTHAPFHHNCDICEDIVVPNKEFEIAVENAFNDLSRNPVAVREALMLAVDQVTSVIESVAVIGESARFADDSALGSVMMKAFRHNLNDLAIIEAKK